jgi:hypothetical protein
MKDSKNLHWKSARISRRVKSDRVSRVRVKSVTLSACSIAEPRTGKILRAMMAIDLNIEPCLKDWMARRDLEFSRGYREVSR